MVRHEGVFNERYELISFKEFKDGTFFSEEIYNYLDDGGMICYKFYENNSCVKYYQSSDFKYNLKWTDNCVTIKDKSDNLHFDGNDQNWCIFVYDDLGRIIFNDNTLGYWGSILYGKNYQIFSNWAGDWCLTIFDENGRIIQDILSNGEVKNIC